jgi:hypothetical protein
MYGRAKPLTSPASKRNRVHNSLKDMPPITYDLSVGLSLKEVLPLPKSAKLGTKLLTHGPLRGHSRSKL